MGYWGQANAQHAAAAANSAPARHTAPCPHALVRRQCYAPCWLACATDAMHVIFNLFGHVVVDDVLQTRAECSSRVPKVGICRCCAHACMCKAPKNPCSRRAAAGLLPHVTRRTVRGHPHADVLPANRRPPPPPPPPRRTE